MGVAKSLSHTSTTTFTNTKPTKPFREVIHQYTNTLCTTQKQMNLTNPLLQDITVFNKYNSTKLDDWLMDIETAANLTNESQPKFAKAKLRGLTHTLVMEVINSDKSWEEIKDLLRLKLFTTKILTITLDLILHLGIYRSHIWILFANFGIKMRCY